MNMKRFAMIAVLALAVPMTGCASGSGSLFSAGSGERILKTTAAGAAVGAAGGLAVAVISEVFNGGSGSVATPAYVPQTYSSYSYADPAVYSRGCRSCDLEYTRQYNAGVAEGADARRYRQMQWRDQDRMLEGIRAERAGAWGRIDGYRDGRYR